MKIRVLLRGYARSPERYMEEIEIELPSGDVEVRELLKSAGLAPDGKFAIFVDRKRVKGKTVIISPENQIEIFSLIGGG